MSSTLGAMWRAFYGNLGKRMHHGTTQDKLKLLKGAVWPVASYRVQRWPYEHTAARRLDQTQNKMLATALRVKTQAHETPDAYARRRNRIVSETAA